VDHPRLRLTNLDRPARVVNPLGLPSQASLVSSLPRARRPQVSNPVNRARVANRAALDNLVANLPMARRRQLSNQVNQVKLDTLVNHPPVNLPLNQASQAAPTRALPRLINPAARDSQATLPRARRLHPSNPDTRARLDSLQDRHLPVKLATLPRARLRLPNNLDSLADPRPTNLASPRPTNLDSPACRRVSQASHLNHPLPTAPIHPMSLAIRAAPHRRDKVLLGRMVNLVTPAPGPHGVSRAALLRRRRPARQRRVSPAGQLRGAHPALDPRLLPPSPLPRLLLRRRTPIPL
jgi:hypothetical protein